MEPLVDIDFSSHFHNASMNFSETIEQTLDAKAGFFLSSPFRQEKITRTILDTSSGVKFEPRGSLGVLFCLLLSHTFSLSSFLTKGNPLCSTSYASATLFLNTDFKHFSHSAQTEVKALFAVTARRRERSLGASKRKSRCKAGAASPNRGEGITTDSTGKVGHNKQQGRPMKTPR